MDQCEKLPRGQMESDGEEREIQGPLSSLSAGPLLVPWLDQVIEVHDVYLLVINKC